MHYLNENDPFAASWLRALIEVGELPEAKVDERDIRDVKGTDLEGFTQCHWFGGIGGWSLALRLAGFPADRECWTGSCPCQPFSAAGKRKGNADERHLWPAWFKLIRERHPECILGEQVASAIGHGWLDGVFADLESEGYACGAVVLGAHSVGAPHIRQRLFWVADAGRTGSQRGLRPGEASGTNGAAEGKAQQRQRGRLDVGSGSELCGLGNAERNRLRVSGRATSDESHEPGNGKVLGLADSERDGRRSDEQKWESEGRAADRGTGAGMRTGGLVHVTSGRTDAAEQSGQLSGTEPSGFWSDFDTVHCRDGKTRRIEPGSFPLAHGVFNRVGLLRGYGNAIVPQVAATFIKAFLEVEAN